MRSIFKQSIWFLAFTIMISTQAKHWPWIIIPSVSYSADLKQNNAIFSTKKKRVCSYKRFAQEKSEQQQSSLFSCLPLQISHPNHQIKRTAIKIEDPLLTVSVLLAKSQLGKFIEWSFASEKGFMVSYGKNKRMMNKVTIKIKNNSIWCNGKRIQESLSLHSLSGYAECNGTIYDGDFVILPYNGIFLCINKVHLEDYITSVLKTESWPGWPLEVNKVLAIACRSYVVFKMFEAQKNNRPFHVKNTNAHQTYKGKHTIAVFQKAVEQTKGIILGFNGKPALTMFDSCCGGIIPAHIQDFAFDKAPYLARSYPCTFCKKFSIFSWKALYEQSDFESTLRKSHYSIKHISDIHISQKDKAGLVNDVAMRSGKSTITISGKALYSCFNEIKSFCFTVVKKSNTILFTGHGFGHHLGLCQWGARQMVTDGWDFKSILRFYFPGTHFMKLIK